MTKLPGPAGFNESITGDIREANLAELIIALKASQTLRNHPSYPKQCPSIVLLLFVSLRNYFLLLT